MSQWGNHNQANNAPEYKVVEDKVAATASRGNTSLFNNTSVGVFHNNQILGVWGANASQVSADHPGNKIPHTGWHYVRQGTGPVTSLTITAGGTGFANQAQGLLASHQTGGNGTFQVTTNSTGGITGVTITGGGAGFNNASSVTITAPANGIINVAIIAGGTAYSNSDTLTFSNGTANGAASLTTNATGGISAVTITNAGRGFAANTDVVVTFNTSTGSTANIVVHTLGTGSGATLTPVLGGRANRVHYETLVAGSMLGSPPNTLP